MPGEPVGEVLQEGHHHRGVVVARVAPGDEDGVQPRAGPVEFFVVAEGLRPLLDVGQVEVRGGPDPVILVVPPADLAHPDVHLAPGHAHEGAGGVVLEGDVLDAVGAEQGELADVLIELLLVPGVPAIGAVPISELVAADRVGRGGRQARPLVEGRRPPGHLQRPQELADPEQDAPRVGPDDPDYRLIGPGGVDGEDEAFRLQAGRLLPEVRGRRLDPGQVVRPRGRQDDRAGRRPFLPDRPADPGPLLGLLDQGRDGGLFRLARHPRTRDDRRPDQLDLVGAGGRDHHRQRKRGAGDAHDRVRPRGGRRPAVRPP